MISAALFGPMPWMYWSAITTRLLVGILTPAIRATNFLLSPIPRGFGTSFLLSQTVVCKSEHDAAPLRFVGARHRLDNYPTRILRLLRDRRAFRQLSLGFSSLFHELFCSPTRNLT